MEVIKNYRDKEVGLLDRNSGPVEYYHDSEGKGPVGGLIEFF